MAGVALRRGQYPSARREGDRAAGPSGARGGQTMYSQRLRSRTVGVAVSAIAIQIAASAARPRATRAALLGGAWLGALAMLAPDAAQAQQGPFLYVPNAGDGTVSVIDTPTNAVAPTAIPVGLSPVAAAVRGDESLVYVTNQGGSNTVSVINTATNTVVATIPVGVVPQLLAVSPDGTRVYVPNEGSNTISVTPSELSLSALRSLPTALASM